jgi:hypothetical protein
MYIGKAGHFAATSHALTHWPSLDDAGEIENPQPHTTAHPPQSLFRQSYPVHSLVDWKAVQMVPFACPESDTDF